jgi:hypothetical protein
MRGDQYRSRRDGAQSGGTMGEREGHALLLSRKVKDTPPVSGDMIGLVALDFILWVVFRGVVNVTLIVKIAGVNRDNGSRHMVRLGIPSDMIADFEPLGHPANSSSSRKSPLRIVAS